MFNLAKVPVPDLTGKTVLVTGAGRGIGAATVTALVTQGATVFAGFYGAADMGALAGAITFPLDVTDQSAVDAAVAQVTAFGGKLDILVNNAGIISPIGHLADLPPDALKAAFEVNVIGLHRMTVACLPLLRASKGVVINAGTGAATTAMEGWTGYCTSKAAARMLTQMMALELGPEGIQSFFIGIPPTDTAMQEQIRKAGLNPISKIPQASLVHPDVPASVIAWLCSDAARAVDEVMLDVRQERFTAMMDLRP
jgi:NAD(P)-dependent dehydrogenase (short-subunit alcohol dehydrogenase family)